VSSLTSRLKPPRWPVQAGLLSPEWQRIYGAAVCLLPLWDGQGETARDISGHGHHGTLKGGANWFTSRYGGAVDFGSMWSYYYIDLPYSDLHALPTTYDFTLVVLSRQDSDPNGDRGPWAFGGTDDLQLYLFDKAVQRPRVYWGNLGGSIINTGLAPYGVGEWVQLAFVSRASNDHRLFVNGAEFATSTATGAAGPFNSLRLGGWADGSQWFDGDIAFFALFDRGLSDGELALLARDPFGLFRRADDAALYAPAAPGDVILDITSGLHGHFSDQETLGQTHRLTSAPATHANQTGQITISQTHNLTSAAAVHASLAGQITVGQSHSLLIAPARHSQTAGTLVLLTSGVLAVAAGWHDQLAAPAALAQIHALFANGGVLGHLAQVAGLFQTGAAPQGLGLSIPQDPRMIPVRTRHSKTVPTKK
jgi:hypothetical protein